MTQPQDKKNCDDRDCQTNGENRSDEQPIQLMCLLFSICDRLSKFDTFVILFCESCVTLTSSVRRRNTDKTRDCGLLNKWFSKRIVWFETNWSFVKALLIVVAVLTNALFWDTSVIPPDKVKVTRTDSEDTRRVESETQVSQNVTFLSKLLGISSPWKRWANTDTIFQDITDKRTSTGSFDTFYFFVESTLFVVQTRLTEIWWFKACFEDTDVVVVLDLSTIVIELTWVMLSKFSFDWESTQEDHNTGEEIGRLHDCHQWFQELIYKVRPTLSLEYTRRLTRVKCNTSYLLSENKNHILDTP